MILRAHAEASFPISRISLNALLLSVYPLRRKLISSTYQGGSWRERITQFRHVTIPRLGKPTNFKTNGTVISTPDMTNSRPFLSCILPLLCTVASLRIPAVSPRHHRDFPLHVTIEKGMLQTRLPFILFSRPVITSHVPAYILLGILYFNIYYIDLWNISIYCEILNLFTFTRIIWYDLSWSCCPYCPIV